MLAALNTKEKAKIREMIASAFAPSDDPDRSLDARTDRLFGLATNEAPMTLMEVPRSDPFETVAIVKTGSGMRLALMIRVEEQPPHRVLGIQLTDPESASQPPMKELTDWKDYPDLLGQALQASGAPGIALAVGRLGQPIMVEAAGVKAVGKPEPLLKTHLLLPGSIAKSITATLIGKLIDEGILRFDMTLAEALPGVKMRDEYKAVTLEQVMQHRSGIIQEMGFTRAGAVERIGGKKDRVEARRFYAEFLLSKAPIGKAGERFAYSNGGYGLLAHVAETAGGKPFEALIKEKLFDPIGMPTAGYYTGVDRTTHAERFGGGHVRTPQGPRPMMIGDEILVTIVGGAGGGLAMSMEDLVRYGLVHLQGLTGTDGYLKSATVKRLHTPLVQASGRELYSCGWSKLPDGVEWHNGSDGSMGADLMVDPKKGLVVAAICTMGGEAEPTPAFQVCRAVLNKG